MGRSVGVVLILGAVAAATLLGPGRHLAAAMYLVELETALPVPLVPTLAGAGAALLLGSLLQRRGRRGAGTARDRSQAWATRAPAEPITTEEPDRQKRVLVRASGLELEQGISLLLPGGLRREFVLQIGDVPPMRARRALDTLARFASEIPTPPILIVRFDGYREVGSPRKTAVAGAFSQHFRRADFTIGPVGDGLAVRFVEPDSRWGEGEP